VTSAEERIGSAARQIYPEEMASNINGASLLIIPESGHLSPLEQPTHVTQALIDLLRIPVGGDDN
jgi:pimeloyl-ACP methyl ester carboxylesterase